MPKWVIKEEKSLKRVNHAAVTIGKKIYTFGGYHEHGKYDGSVTMDVSILDTDWLKWKTLETPKPKTQQYKVAPMNRFGHTAVYHDTTVYIWGGSDEVKGEDNLLYCFNPETLKWSLPEVSGPEPSPHDGHTACCVNNCMIIFGGFDILSEKYTNEVFSLKLINLSWTKVITKGIVPKPRDFHTASVIGQKMYIFGGRLDESGPSRFYNTELLSLDTQSWTWETLDAKGKSPIMRRSHCSFIHKDLLYIFGGYDDAISEYFEDFNSYDPGKNQWYQLRVTGNRPIPRRRGACCVMGDKMYLFGGTCPRAGRVKDKRREVVNLQDLSDLHIMSLDEEYDKYSVSDMVCIDVDSTEWKRLEREAKHSKYTKYIDQAGIVNEITAMGDLSVCYGNKFVTLTPLIVKTYSSAAPPAADPDPDPASQCKVCLTNDINMVFNCGHGICSDCATSLQTCHMCRTPITSRQKVFFN